jgi:putative SOS response-associated peptidase YedK
LLELLVPAPSDEFVAYPISKLVNKPENQGPELLEPIDPDADEEDELRLL